MSNEQATVPHQMGGFYVRSLAVEVTRGPDQGARHVSTSDTLTIGTGPANDLVLTDPTVSRYHLELRREEDRIALVDNGSTNGVEAGGVRVRSGWVRPGTTLVCGKTRLKIQDDAPLTLEALDADEIGGLRGRSPAMRRVFAQLTRAAKSDAAVLLLGETGTGKEGLGRLVHDESPRAAGPFEVVDCGTLMPNLIASELFGHEQGAFTGATKRHIGAFERAAGGTLFLDEVGELPLELQPALLGVLERKQLRRVGGAEPISTDVRFVAATHQDLRAQVNEGRFRPDLFFRLAVVQCRVPPLRARREDIPLLIEHFLHQAGHDCAVSDVIPQAQLDTLRAHAWPGNVRELRNYVEAALALGQTPELDGEEGARDAVGQGMGEGMGALLDLSYADARTRLIHRFEQQYLPHLLERADGNVSKASRMAQMNRSYLRQLLKKHGLGR